LALIECRDVTLKYDDRTVLSGLSFKISAGDRLSIIGENGSGKSTLVKALLSLKSPSSGKIIFGEGLTKSDIGYLPQRTDAARDFPASVREVVLSGCRTALPFYRRSEKELCLKNLERLGISELCGRSFSELSGGQQQRVLLARALCAAKRVIITDEPAASLDPEAAAGFYSLTDSLAKDGMTIISVSHDIANSLKYSSHILHLGSTVFFGTVSEYLETPDGRRYAADCGGKE